MRIRHFNIAGVAWSNFEPGVDINERAAILSHIPYIEEVDMGAGVNVAVVMLSGRGKEGGWGGCNRSAK